MAEAQVAEAKVLSTKIALQAIKKLFELAGTRAALGIHNLDCYNPRNWTDPGTFAQVALHNAGSHHIPGEHHGCRENPDGCVL